MSIRRSDGWTAFIFAAQFGFVSMMKGLNLYSSTKFDPNEKLPSGQTALHIAAANNHADVIIYLVSMGSDVSKVCNEGRSAIHYAIMSGAKEALNVLLKYQGTNLKNRYYVDPPTFTAAKINKLTCLETLLDAGVDINSSDKNGCTALHASSYFGHFDIVSYLVKSGADLYIVDRDSCTALTYAILKKDNNLIELLLDNMDFNRINFNDKVLLKKYGIVLDTSSVLTDVGLNTILPASAVGVVRNYYGFFNKHKMPQAQAAACLKHTVTQSSPSGCNKPCI